MPSNQSVIQRYRYIIIAFLLCLLCALIFAKFTNLFESNKNTAHLKSVKVVKLEPQDILNHVDLPGRTVAYNIAQIRPQVSGIIIERLFTEGGYVEAGQKLYLIDDVSYRAIYRSALANVQKAEANFKSMQAQYSRYSELVKIDAVSRQEYENIEAAFTQAKAEIAVANASAEQAKINLDYTNVYAPISGIIGKSNVTRGALVTSMQPEILATITTLNPIYVDLTQSSGELMRIREKIKNLKKTRVKLFVDSSTTPYSHSGVLMHHEVTVQQNTDSVELRAVFTNPDQVLLPGLFVRAQLELESYKALLIPQSSATLGADGKLSVWKVSAGNNVTLASVVASGTQDGYWIVTDGLVSGDVIVTEGFMNLTTGTSVNPIFEEESTSSKAR